jgi:hypothetical protein
MSKAFSHDRVKDGKDEWLTPKWITDELGPFDLDPCSPINRPWETARVHFNQNDDGLPRGWFGKVWLNPPYGTQTGRWMKKMKEHNNGFALIFARTETSTFFDSVWDGASSILFLKGRISFHHVNGDKSGPAGAPSVIISYGKESADLLERKVYLERKFKGAFLRLTDNVIINHA